MYLSVGSRVKLNIKFVHGTGNKTRIMRCCIMRRNIYITCFTHWILVNLSKIIQFICDTWFVLWYSFLNIQIKFLLLFRCKTKLKIIHEFIIFNLGICIMYMNTIKNNSKESCYSLWFLIFKNEYFNIKCLFIISQWLFFFKLIIFN